MFSIIVAADSKNGIGKNNDIPWNIPKDMKYFNDVTTDVTTDVTNHYLDAPGNKQNVVIMGRRTWESIPGKYRPLKDRINVIISRTMEPPKNEEYYICKTYSMAMNEWCMNKKKNINRVFLIGGAGLYFQGMRDSMCAMIYLTRIYGDFGCDRNIPEIDGTFKITSCENLQTTKESGIDYRFIIYTRTRTHYDNVPEHEYLNLIRRTLKNGDERSDRTGTGTISTFGEKMVFNLEKDGFPILTTKRVPFKMVIKELLWFLAGDTNNKHLQDQGVHIWDGNTSRDFLDKRGLQHYQEGDIGPTYGFQWRHFGAEYEGCDAEYSGKGVDQIKEVIRQIKEEPASRRIIFTAWNPSALHGMVLPPCHSIVVQFYVRNGKDGNKKFLDCQMYQRSADEFLGIPFNITSYALLLQMISQVTDLKPGKLIMVLGDSHIYKNHVEQVNEQLGREPRAFPVLNINKNVKDIDSFTLDDFELLEYRPHLTIKAPMAI